MCFCMTKFLYGVVLKFSLINGRNLAGDCAWCVLSKVNANLVENIQVVLIFFLKSLLRKF